EALANDKEPGINIEVVADVEQAVRDGTRHLGFRVPDVNTLPATFNRDLALRNLALDWDIIYREDSPASTEALAYVQKLITSANQEYLTQRLKVLGVSQRAVPVKASTLAVQAVSAPRNQSLAGLIPLILILMTITGAVYPAIDLTAGERERGTLETLV